MIVEINLKYQDQWVYSEWIHFSSIKSLKNKQKLARIIPIIDRVSKWVSNKNISLINEPIIPIYPKGMI